MTCSQRAPEVQKHSSGLWLHILNPVQPDLKFCQCESISLEHSTNEPACVRPSDASGIEVEITSGCSKGKYHDKTSPVMAASLDLSHIPAVVPRFSYAFAQDDATVVDSVAS